VRRSLRPRLVESSHRAVQAPKGCIEVRARLLQARMPEHLLDFVKRPAGLE